MPDHIKYMHRCLELAQNGLGHTVPNPLVGCVIVYDDRIIGEGFHRVFGGPHAEVNAIQSVKNKELLPGSSLYVNLEPCAHHGKTPPCTDLIIANKIPHVIIGCQDIFAEVNGKGIEKLQKAGVVVETGVLEKESKEINKRFFTFHGRKRPYIILKWAQTADGFIAREDHNSKWISNEYSRLLVHKWRSEEAAIMVGTNTALYDNPQLSSRDMKTRNPIRIVLDKNNRIPETHHLFDGSQPTIIYTEIKSENSPNTIYEQIDFGVPHFLKDLMHNLYKRDIQSVIVEGGAALLQSFINADQWDEARIYESKNVYFEKGIKAPILDNEIFDSLDIMNDRLNFYSKAM